MMRRAGVVVGLTGALGVVACGGTVDVPEPEIGDPTGVWQFSDATVEITLELDEGGTFQKVEAATSAMLCGRDSGDWSVSADALVLDADPTSGGGQERFTFSVEGTSLSLTDASGATRVFMAVPSGLSCVDYGFGAWEGTVSASIDGEARTFDDLVVDLDVEGGSLRLTSLYRPCPTCPTEDPELVIEIEAPGALVAGSYTVQNFAGAEMTMFGFFHPDPTNPDFEGFSTERLSPPGETVVTAVADERVSATFTFRGNPRTDGDVAPDGSTSTLVTDGVVDLTYR